MTKKTRLLLAILTSFLSLSSLNAAEIHQEVKPFLRESFPKILQQAKGKATAIIFWSLTCAPCIREMPIWKELGEKYPKINLVFISTDDQKNEAKEIQALLKKHNLFQYESWAFADSFAERVRFAVDPMWYGELPLTYLLEASGKRKKIVGMVSKKDLENWKKGEVEG